jgi:outer membrane immunogenic protein
VNFMKLLRMAGFVAMAAGVLAASGSHAADSAAAGTSWAGPYAGVYAGYGWGTADSTAPFDPGPGFFYNFGGDRYSFSADGFFGGATAGYNWQRGALVTGAEVEIGYLGLQGSREDPNGVVAGFPDTTTSLKSDLFGALTARMGLATGKALVYVKGGAAFLKARATTIDPCVAPPAGCGTETLSMSGSKSMVGWTLGAGVEWELAPRWSLKAELSYFDFGDLGASGASSTGAPYFQTVDVRARTARIGVNYRF